MSLKDKCFEKLSYDQETGIFTWNYDGTRGVKAGDIAGYKMPDGYIMLSVGGRKIVAHRVAWLFVYGEFPEGNLDHINRNKADNRIANLRNATYEQNAQNREKNCRNTSGYKGVTWHKRDQRWQAAITIKRKVIHLGYYQNPLDAYSAYIEASKKYQSHSIFKEN
jgi:hypothetical protein